MNETSTKWAALRKATFTNVHDIASLFVTACALWKQTTIHEIAYEYWASVLRTPGFEVWVLEDDGRLVGFADMAAVQSPTSPYRRVLCQYMFVLPGYSAFKLMAQLKRFVRKNKADSVDIFCEHDTRYSLMWMSHGFAPCITMLRGPRTWNAYMEDKDEC